MRGHTRPKSSEKNGKFGDQLGWEKAQGWSREACELGYVSILAKSWDFVLEWEPASALPRILHLPRIVVQDEVPRVDGWNG
jgi:hypothetical protein